MNWGIWGLGLSLAWANAAPGVSLQDIAGWVNRGEVRSVEDVLVRLPDDLRSRFVLMEKSRSLQEASPDAPRAILYGNTADLVVSFNGKAGQRGFQTIEAIEHNPARSTYELRQFDFSGAKPRVSPPNPEICVRCHRNVPRPNWEPYPYWPGALGQGPNFSSEESKRLAEFASANARHPQYGRLKFTAKRSTPAFELYTLFTEQNLNRIPRALAATPDFLRFRPALLAALADCPNLTAWPLPNGNWDALRQDTLRRFQMLPAPYQTLLTSAIPSVMTKLRYVLETRGFPVDVLPNSFTDRFFLTAAGSVIPQIVARLPAGKVKTPLAALSAYFQPGTRPYGAAEKKAHADFCAALKQEFK